MLLNILFVLAVIWLSISITSALYSAWWLYSWWTEETSASVFEEPMVEEERSFSDADFAKMQELDVIDQERAMERLDQYPQVDDLPF